MGAIGKAMALTLAKRGFPLVVYDVRPEPFPELASAGARVATSSREAATACDVLLIMVRNYHQAEAALAGADGALKGLRPGMTVVVMSTIAPSQTRQLAAIVASTGARYLDAPVSGGFLRAAEGTLTIMVGGPQDVLEECRPVLQAMSTNIYHAGAEVGAGQTLKMVNQMLVGVHEVAAAEAMVLGMKAGIDPDLLYDVVSRSAGDSWIFRNRMERVIARDFSSKGALEILLKDLGIVLSAAQELQMPLLLAPVAYQVYQMAAVAGLANEDDSAVVKVIEGLAGAEVRKKAIEET